MKVARPRGTPSRPLYSTTFTCAQVNCTNMFEQPETLQGFLKMHFEPETLVLKPWS